MDRMPPSSLVGGTIVQVEEMEVEGEKVPILIVAMPRQGQGRGRRYLQVEAWRDPEGNGPGYFSIGPLVQ